MKILNLLLVASLAVGLQAQTVRGNYIKNLPSSIKSIDNGGTLTAAQAHTDGIGVIIVDETLDNSAYNTLANKYAAEATKLIEHVLLDPSISTADKALALSLLADTPDGTACDDGNAVTFGETYLIGVCQGGVANGTSCDDGNSLSFGETYLAGTCQGGFANGDACDDKNALTSGDKYIDGVCTGVDLSGKLVFSNGTLYCNGSVAGATLVEGVDGIPDVDADGIVDTYYVASAVVDIKTKITAGIPANNICTSKILDMSYLFYPGYYAAGATFNQNISNWDVSNVSNMKAMFYGATAFNQPLNTWNTSRVTSMEGMFLQASNFNQSLNSWNVNNVTTMRNMFNGATKFNQPLNNWDVSKAADMYAMFAYASAFNQNLTAWNVLRFTAEPGNFKLNSLLTLANSPIWGHGGVEDLIACQVNAIYTANNAADILSLIGHGVPANNICVKKLTSFASLFNGNANFNEPINTWITSHVTDMGYMFSGAVTFNQNISNWDVSNVSNMKAMFYGATAFNQPLNTWNTSRVTSMEGMFLQASNFNQSLNSWNVNNVTTMRNMFNGATKFNQNLTGWDVLRFTTEPISFSFNSPLTLANKPLWGTSGL